MSKPDFKYHIDNDNGCLSMKITITGATEKQLWNTVQMLRREALEEVWSPMSNISGAKNATAKYNFSSVETAYKTNSGTNKLAAVKEYKNLTKADLRTSKENVEHWIETGVWK